MKYSPQSRKPAPTNGRAQLSKTTFGDVMNINNQSTAKLQGAIKPPVETLHVNSWHELPDCLEPMTYRIIGDDQTFTAQKKTRQVLEALIRQPLACASKCRLSDRVLLLRRNCGLNIKMEMFKCDNASNGEAFGVYFLASKVERIGGVE